MSTAHISDEDLFEALSYLRTAKILDFRGEPQRKKPNLTDATWNKAAEYLNEQQTILIEALDSVDIDTPVWNAIKRAHIAQGQEIQITCREIMTEAKVCQATYYKQLNELTDCGAYKYIPGISGGDSSRLRTRSRLSIIDLEALPQRKPLTCKKYIESTLSGLLEVGVSFDPGLDESPEQVLEEDSQIRLGFRHFLASQGTYLGYLGLKRSRKAKFTRGFKSKLNEAGLNHLLERAPGDWACINGRNFRPMETYIIFSNSDLPELLRIKEELRTEMCIAMPLDYATASHTSIIV